MKKSLAVLLFIFAFAAVVTTCTKEKSCEGCMTNNKAPVADAGTDQIITLPADSVLLDGSSSKDPDGKINEWLWTKISGPASFKINNSASAKTSVKNLTAGIYYFELKVTDDGGLPSKDTIHVKVNAATPVNHPPVANAGVNQTITLPINSITLDGSGSSDPDNNITGYTWTKISGPLSFNIGNANAVQTQVINLEEGTYLFELKVSDAGGLFDRDTIQIFVTLPQQQTGNLVFFFPDPTGSMDPNNAIEMTFDRPLKLVIVKIANFPDGHIDGMWCNSCTPRCPISTDYYVELDNYTSFTLPPGTYTWTAETVIQNFNGYPFTNGLSFPSSIVDFFAIKHNTGGTVTILPNDNCVIKKIIF